MGSLRGETMAVRRHVVYPISANSLTAGRRDTGEILTSPISSNGVVRSNNLISGSDGRALRQRSSSNRGFQSASPSPSPSPSSGSGLRSAVVRGQPAAVTTISTEQGLKGQRGTTRSGWTRGRLQSDVFTFASDTEATSPALQR